MIETLSQPQTVTTTEHIVIYKDNSKIIRLKGYGTSGYLWTFFISEPNVVAVSPTYKQDEAEAEKTQILEGMHVGGCIDELFEINGIGLGEVKVTFILSRPWEDEDPCLRHIVYIDVLNNM